MSTRVPPGTGRWMLGAGALLYLIVMILAGHLPGHGHFVAFEPAGPLREPPEAVTQVVLRDAAAHATLRRRAGRWEDARGQPLEAATAARLALALRFMHTAAAVRTLPPVARAADAAAYGLAPPALRVELAGDAGVLLAFDLGGPNPDGMLRYLSVRTSRQLLLVDDFVGAAWDALAREVSFLPADAP